jgi:hypothetical protein
MTNSIHPMSGSGRATQSSQTERSLPTQTRGMEVDAGVAEKVRVALVSATTCADSSPLLVAMSEPCKAAYAAARGAISGVMALVAVAAFLRS